MIILSASQRDLDSRAYADRCKPNLTSITTGLPIPPFTTILFPFQKNSIAQRLLNFAVLQ